MAGYNKSSEDKPGIYYRPECEREEPKKMTTKYICLKCDHDYSEITFDKSEYKEVLVCPNCQGACVDQWKLPSYKKEQTKQDIGQLKVDIDFTDVIKGLKSIQREAKKATAALRELEEQQKRNSLRPSGNINQSVNANNKPFKYPNDDVPEHVKQYGKSSEVYTSKGAGPKVYFRGDQS